MGICYEVMMRDPFDWGYVGTTRKLQLEKFEVAFAALKGRRPKRLGEWYGHAVYDLEKAMPIGEVAALILQFCDNALYWDDLSPAEGQLRPVVVQP